MAEGFEPSITGLTIRCLTNLATPQEFRIANCELRIGGDEGSRTLIVRFTKPTLCYPVELHRRSLVELRGVEPLRPACKAGIIPLDHSPENWSRRRESNPHPFVYETNALPHELLRKNDLLAARGGVSTREIKREAYCSSIKKSLSHGLNLVPFHPALCRFGLEDRCRERGPHVRHASACR